jgi:hypothetical protein
VDDTWKQIFWQELSRTATALERIATTLEALLPPEQPEPETPTCLHPMDCRIDFGTTNGQPDWMCTVCKYRTPCLPLDPATTIPAHP